MKHLLPVLTLALLGATAAMSAADSYDPTLYNPLFVDKYNYEKKYVDYYENPDVTVSTNKKIQTIDYGSYSVIKEADRSWSGSTLQYNSYFRVHADENIDFYLYDYVNNTGSSTNSNGLLESNVSKIGYRRYVLNDNGEYKLSEQKTFKLKADSNELFDVDFAGKQVDITRNIYKLGTFNANEEFEIFMSYNADDSEGTWSDSVLVLNRDNVDAEFVPGGYSLYESKTEKDSETNEETVTWYTREGLSPNVDKLMWAYQNGSYSSAMYGQNPDSNPDKQIKDDESANAMPLASLDPSGRRVTFGLYAKPVGHPLPGGLPIALVACLFGFGFWYVRRRKATVA